jgi:nucleoside-diphosphate-sugar epimerase
MNILISGYTGFIGSNLTINLNNHLLFGVDLKKNSSVSFHYSWETIYDCKKIDCIIHLAGKAHDTQNTSEEHEYYDINVGLTQKIFQYFLNSSAKKFIFFSSIKAVKDTFEIDYLTENEDPNPQTPYGKSKLEAERYILSQSLPKGKKIYILRPCMIHGPLNKGNLTHLYNLVKKGFPWPLGNYENRRSFTSIDNLIFIIQQLLEKDIESGIYHIADDEAISTNELIMLIAVSLKRKPKIWNIPSKLVIKLAKIGDYLPLPLNTERLKKLTETFLVSNLKIKNALNIEKMPIRAKEGLRKTFASFQK